MKLRKSKVAPTLHRIVITLMLRLMMVLVCIIVGEQKRMYMRPQTIGYKIMLVLKLSNLRKQIHHLLTLHLLMLFAPKGKILSLRHLTSISNQNNLRKEYLIEILNYSISVLSSLSFLSTSKIAYQVWYWKIIP